MIKDKQLVHRIDYSGVGKAKKAITTLYGVPMNALNCVDHGSIVQVGNGVSLLIQSKEGRLKAGDESRYLMVVGKTSIVYDLDSGVEVARKFQQFQLEVSGIEIRPNAS